eukprot:TRINITY_DN4025_c0_g2_i1.p1 TRINITY_DN4025_c0_g2~~TRINITY_DN4025_c0_g2_i1.p1  ORF type:complete len:136 (-),score=20.08 TRINITY_DN4025_c0_g2_i1:376-783(-)
MHIIYANRAACFLKLQDPQRALEDATKSAELCGDFVKAHLRCAQAHDMLGAPEAALKCLDTALSVAGSSPPQFLVLEHARVKQIVANKHEQEKQEMMGKLKDLGNSLLGKIGLSLDNFKLNQDPQTGSYSVQFQR